MTDVVRVVDAAQYREPAAQFRFRHHHRHVGQVAVARQRAARILGLADRGPAGLAKYDRHQESSRRRADRTDDLRQGSRRVWWRQRKALDRVLLWNFYRRAAIHLRLLALCALGSLQPCRAAAEIRPSPDCRRYGGGMPTRLPRSASDLEGFSRMAALPPARARSRRWRAGRGAFRPAAAATDADAEVHGISVFGDLKYPADFQHFDYVNTAAPKGGLFSLIPSVRALQPVVLHVQFAQRLHPQGRGRAGHGHDLRAADGTRG